MRPPETPTIALLLSAVFGFAAATGKEHVKTFTAGNKKLVRFSDWVTLKHY